MKRNVILSHELGIGDIIGPLIRTPPTLPIVAFARIINPFLRTGDVFDGCIKPDIENLAFHPRPIGVTTFDWYTPIQITGNPPIL